MVVSRIDVGGAPAFGSSPLQNEPRRSACVTHPGLKSFFHRSPSRTQRTSVCKLQSSCNSLRLGAAEEGKSSWEDKLESTSTRKGNIVEGESDTTWRDRIVDEEENIDNVEQEQSRRPCEKDAALEQWPGDQGVRPDNLICTGNMLARDQDQSQQEQHMHNNSSAARRFNPSFENFSQTMEGPDSAQTMDLAEERGPVVPLLSTSKLWPGEDGIKEGDKGEAIVGNVHVFASHSQGEILPTQFQEREKYGWSEATCDEGSLSRSDPHEHGEGKEMQEDKLQHEEEEVFQEDEGRTPGDYQRRADLFGKSGEQFVAQKQRDDRKSV